MLQLSRHWASTGQLENSSPALPTSEQPLHMIERCRVFLSAPFYCRPSYFPSALTLSPQVFGNRYVSGLCTCGISLFSKAECKVTVNLQRGILFIGLSSILTWNFSISKFAKKSTLPDLTTRQLYLRYEWVNSSPTSLGNRLLSFSQRKSVNQPLRNELESFSRESKKWECQDFVFSHHQPSQTTQYRYVINNLP